jgi:predicted phage-related endonuclease
MLDEKLREPRIGGSEIAAIFHRHEYLDEFGLWARKKGDLPREEAGPNWGRMRLGKHLEQGIVSYAAELNNWKYEWSDRTVLSERYPFMVATPDALMPEIRWGIDAKLVAWDQAHRWGRSVDTIPDMAVMQAWWYMAHFDYEGWYVAALIMGEDLPRVYPIPRDPEAEKIMLRKAEWWWKRYLVGDERPPITASNESDRWLKRHYPRPRRVEIPQANPDQAEILDEYAQVRRDWTCIDTRRKDLEAEIKAQIGERSGLIWPGGKFTWKLTKDSSVTEWEELAKVLVARHPAGEQLQKEFTRTKPGIRRIYYKGARGEEVEL